MLIGDVIEMNASMKSIQLTQPMERRLIVLTPTGQAQYETLMHGDLTEARKIALRQGIIRGEAPNTKAGEMYNYNYYTFPEGEALRYTMSASDYSESSMR